MKFANELVVKKLMFCIDLTTYASTQNFLLMISV